MVYLIMVAIQQAATHEEKSALKGAKEHQRKGKTRLHLITNDQCGRKQ